jgi:hypothetical protein
MTMGYLAGRTLAGQSPEYRPAEQPETDIELVGA